jgi:tetratricopeptide (TPR) repeat protein
MTETQLDVFSHLVERKGGVVLREEFRPWQPRKAEPDRRHPVDTVVSELRKLLPKEVAIKTVWGRGYRLSNSVPVTEVAGISVPRAVQARIIGLDRMNIHTLQSLRASIEKYEEVLREGPDADAYANLAMCYINEGHVGFCRDFPQRTILKARALLDEALRHYPHFSSVYALRGLTHLIFDYDWKRAESGIADALQLNEDDEYAHVIAAHMEVSRGNFDLGLTHARRAAELDWRSPMTVFTAPWMLVFSGRAGEAINEAERAIKDFDPFAVGHIICGYAWESNGMPEQAITEYKRSLDIAPFPDAFASLGHASAIAGDKRAARSYLAKLQTFEGIAYVSGYLEALVYVGLGDHPHALEALERSYQEKCDWLIYLKVEPRWQPLRHEKRFQSLLRKVGL